MTVPRTQQAPLTGETSRAMQLFAAQVQRGAVVPARDCRAQALARDRPPPRPRKMLAEVRLMLHTSWPTHTHTTFAGLPVRLWLALGTRTALCWPAIACGDAASRQPAPSAKLARSASTRKAAAACSAARSCFRTLATLSQACAVTPAWGCRCVWTKTSPRRRLSSASRA